MKIKKSDIGSLIIPKGYYEFEFVDGEPKIIISRVRVNNVDGKYIKFAKLENVIDYLSEFPLKFESKTEN
jgi:hypothetical protein|tara:strand:- start:976 stop:1185 length:210 start_codon:yes stop_codon:yes gene_type:complete